MSSEIRKLRDKLDVLNTEGIYQVVEDVLLFKGVWEHSEGGIEKIVKELRVLYLKRLKELLPVNPKQKTLFNEQG